jgi:hypothetical protein
MSGVLDPGFRAALCKTYADLLRRQRTAASPFAQWSRATRREHEFQDKALEVVDETLRKLNLAELPMTLLRRDKESKRELLGRLERVEKRRPADEVNAHYETLATTLEEASGEQVADAKRYAAALSCRTAPGTQPGAVSRAWIVTCFSRKVAQSSTIAPFL